MLVIDKATYYTTDEWKRISDECRQLAGNTCSMCSSTDNLHAHHLTYDRLGAELQSDLQCLCVDCHEKVHDMTPGTLRNRKNIRGGFNMIYHKSYEEVTEEAIKSNNDIKLFNWVTNQFTYARVEVPLVFGDCPISVSQSTFSRMIKTLVTLGYIKRVSRGLYRLNPYIYIPYKADGSELQAEWLKLTKDNQ